MIKDDGSLAIQITAFGGGGAASYGETGGCPCPLYTAGQGSGGGAGHQTGSCPPPVLGGKGTAGPPRQGFDGGTMTTNSGSGSGGGGAGGVGSNINPGNGFGGPGLSSNITGTDLYYAGGGGGGNNDFSADQGFGGSGGGGAGSLGTYNNIAAIWQPKVSSLLSLNPGTQGVGCSLGGSGGANTGGGGGGCAGGCANSCCCTGGNGGSGVVIISYPSSDPASVTTGTNVYKSIANGQQIYVFQKSGSIVFPS